MSPRKKKPEEGRPDIRRRILEFLKSRGRASIDEVADRFRIGHEGARKQLNLMEGHGWVERAGDAPENSGRGRGRPRMLYRVSPAGEHVFPKAYDRLSMALFTSLAEQGRPDTLRQVLASLADKQVAAWKPALEGKTPKEKLKALRDLYQEDDPFMSVEERDGDLVLIERNCPFLSVALSHPALCSLSVMTLERLLERPVVREERFQAGHGRCMFRVKVDAPAPKADFRLEDGTSAQKSRVG
jgi:predicted ArsR family transcriptional regulator